MGFFDLFKKKQNTQPTTPAERSQPTSPENHRPAAVENTTKQENTSPQPAARTADREQAELNSGLEKTKTGLFSKLARAVAGRSTIDTQVLGLELGADDYIVKPFDTKEVVARIKAIARRVSAAPAETEVREVRYDKLSVNMTRYELRVNGKVVDTPPKELELLFYLASNPNRVYTRDQLLDEVWGFEYYGDSRTIDVHIKRLREKLEGVSDKWALKTVWGVGYKFESEEEE